MVYRYVSRDAVLRIKKYSLYVLHADVAKRTYILEYDTRILELI